MKFSKHTFLWLVLGGLAIGAGLFYFFDADGWTQSAWVFSIFSSLASGVVASFFLSFGKAWKQTLGFLLYFGLYSLGFSIIAPLTLSPLQAMQSLGAHLKHYEAVPDEAVYSEDLVLQTVAQHKHALSLPHARFTIKAGIEYSDMQEGSLECGLWDCHLKGLDASVRSENSELYVEARDGSWELVLDSSKRIKKRYTENGITLYVYPQSTNYSDKVQDLKNPYEVGFCRWLRDYLTQRPSEFPVSSRRMTERQ